MYLSGCPLADKQVRLLNRNIVSRDGLWWNGRSFPIEQNEVTLLPTEAGHAGKECIPSGEF
jgi:hypothetical protein